MHPPIGPAVSYTVVSRQRFVTVTGVSIRHASSSALSPRTRAELADHRRPAARNGVPAASMPSLSRSLMAKTLTKPRLLPPRATRATHNIGSKSKLRPRDIPSFADAQPPLFKEVACAVCTASVLPRKELYEAWAVATRVDAAFTGYTRVADLAAGHGLLAWLLLLLAWERGAPRTAVCVDVRMPASHETLSAALVARWPRLDGALPHLEPPP